jgi:shikimate kinase
VSPRVVLVGMPGTGKSTTGRRLGRILGVPFADSDALVEREAGRTVTQMFAETGEAAFRAVESAVVRAALVDFDGVLALGGGAVTDAGVRRALAESRAPVVLLRASVPTLLARVGDAEHRPLLSGDAATRLAELAADRAAGYAECATLTVPTDHRTPGQVAAQIAERLRTQVEL